MSRKITGKILFFVFVLVIVALGGSYYLSSDQQHAADYSEATRSERIISKKEEADLDNNAIQETYSLENGRLTIMESLKVIWQSPDDWWLDDFVLADTNNDGVIDINLSLWKAGDFGNSKPFWVKENDWSIKNHFFIFDLIGGALKMVWGSSNLGVPNCEFKIEDLDNDGKSDLVVLEGAYSQRPACHGNYIAIWQWNDWGFTNEWRSDQGTFANLKIEAVEGKKYIEVDSENGVLSLPGRPNVNQ
ncbi:MAG TPA: hypothetical protein P5267_00770 [Patescibacteria group bacterium]|nr:hypothetical protein [Patescibacteria group bacterium]